VWDNMECFITNIMLNSLEGFSGGLAIYGGERGKKAVGGGYMNYHKSNRRQRPGFHRNTKNFKHLKTARLRVKIVKTSLDGIVKGTVTGMEGTVHLSKWQCWESKGYCCGVLELSYKAVGRVVSYS